MKSRWALLMAAALLSSPPLSAADAKAPTLYHIACPEVWPGPEQPGARLNYAFPWFDHVFAFGP